MFDIRTINIKETTRVISNWDVHIAEKILFFLFILSLNAAIDLVPPR